MWMPELTVTEPKGHYLWNKRSFSECCLGPGLTVSYKFPKFLKVLVLIFKVWREMSSQVRYLVQDFPSSKGLWH